MKFKKTVIIGLDGATWKLLDPLLQQGRLPNLQKIVSGGARATLLSTKPPVTVPAWTTFATGVQPGKHGCYDFFLPGRTLADFRPATSQAIKLPTLYELLEAAGKKCILINLPNSYPPRLPSMTMVTDFMTIGNDYIFPQTLAQKYPILQRYRLSPDERIRLTQDTTTYIRHILDLERDRVTAVKQLFTGEPWDLFFFLFSSTDWISHLVFYDMVEQDHLEAMKVFDLVDTFFGWLLQQLTTETTLYVMSDHGFTYYTELFYINRWLEQQGYLTTTSGAGQLEEAATARRRSLAAARRQGRLRLRLSKRWLDVLFFHPAIERLLKQFYHAILKPLFPISLAVDVGIDLAKTKVCFPRGSMLQTLYLNYRGNFDNGLITDRAEYDTIRADVKAKLEVLRTSSGKRVTEHVYTKEELYGDHPPVPSPDLHCATKDVWIVGHLHSKTLFEKKISNKHDAYGMFVAYGADIQPSQQLPNLSIADLTPTVLHQFGLSIPQYSDGRVVQELFLPDTDAARRPPRFSKHVATSALIDSIAI